MNGGSLNKEGPFRKGEKKGGFRPIQATPEESIGGSMFKKRLPLEKKRG